MLECFSNICGPTGSEPEVDPRSGLIDLPVLQKFKLYETQSNWYLIGRDEKKSFKRILKIDRTDQNELNLFEDPTKYTNKKMRELKTWLKIGNEHDGEFKPHLTCYGIIGFVRFLAPYYMLVITRIKKVGEICGHTIYGIAETKMITIPNRLYQTTVADSEAENSYKKLLDQVDLTKNFYFSYTYHLMYSLQRNVRNTEKGKKHDDNRFVWNAHLTRGVRGILKNTTWTVALIYGFFEQNKCSVSGQEFLLTVIARRSRLYAGTRYLRRGVNDVGGVANDVETEQIVSKEVPEGEKIPITSVVQMRGSIPLYWSQEASLLRPQPNIILYKKEPNYKATQYHFDNLGRRYGNQIMILNLLKTRAEKNREIMLWTEYCKAIRFINSSVTNKNYSLVLFNFDLSRQNESEGVADSFKYLCRFAERALERNSLFFCNAPSGVGGEEVVNDSFGKPLPPEYEEANSPEKEAADIIMLQNGILRTNCIDCLDRTNFSQYAHGLKALEAQLKTLDITAPRIIDIENPLALKLMEVYVNMGDTISLQYGGSGAHTEMFNDLTGTWNVASRPRKIFISLDRHLKNVFQDNHKQNAIDLFLGQYQPQLGKTPLWDIDPRHTSMARNSSDLDIEHMRPLRRTLSDTNLLGSELNLNEMAHIDPQPSPEGLTEGISEMNSSSAFHQTEPPSLRLDSALSSEDHLRRTESNQVVQGSTSHSEPDDVPGYAHSFDATFTSAERMFQRGSAMSVFSGINESGTSMSDTEFNFNASSGSRRRGNCAERILASCFERISSMGLILINREKESGEEAVP